MKEPTPHDWPAKVAMVAGLTRQPEGCHAIFKILLILRVSPLPQEEPCSCINLKTFTSIFEKMRLRGKHSLWVDVFLLFYYFREAEL